MYKLPEPAQALVSGPQQASVSELGPVLAPGPRVRKDLLPESGPDPQDLGWDLWDPSAPASGLWDPWDLWDLELGLWDPSGLASDPSDLWDLELGLWDL